MPLQEVVVQIAKRIRVDDLRLSCTLKEHSTRRFPCSTGRPYRPLVVGVSLGHRPRPYIILGKSWAKLKTPQIKSSQRGFLSFQVVIIVLMFVPLSEILKKKKSHKTAFMN